MEDEEEEMTEAELAKKAENKFGVLLMTDDELKEHKQRLRAKPTGKILRYFLFARYLPALEHFTQYTLVAFC